MARPPPQRDRAPQHHQAHRPARLQQLGLVQLGAEVKRGAEHARTARPYLSYPAARPTGDGCTPPATSPSIIARRLPTARVNGAARNIARIEPSVAPT